MQHNGVELLRRRLGGVVRADVSAFECRYDDVDFEMIVSILQLITCVVGVEVVGKSVVKCTQHARRAGWEHVAEVVPLLLLDKC